MNVSLPASIVPALQVWARRLWAVAALLFISISAHGQSLESIMAPGKVIQGHAKLEDDCKQCHVKFDRKAQDGLCMGCHKEVGADVRGKTGLHGRQSNTTCHDCHTDHKGRNARVAELDKNKFDHSKTDFRLAGKHAQADCAKCHTAGKKFREVAADCGTCHKKDDTHKGSLGTQCADCHNETKWTETRFDHETTRFPLTGKHSNTQCADCHKNNVYKDTPKTCVACHRADDNKNGHKGQFGEKCDSCHTTRQWKTTSFNHDTDTRYALRGKHRSAACKDCHTGALYRDKLAQECYACHKKDDKHKETLGRDCGSCHSEKSWKEPPKFDHDTSRFPLLGKHAKAECSACHKSPLFKEAPKDCIGCHLKDDKHKASLGKDCAACHTERDWKTTDGRFSHERTRFPLRNAHAGKLVKCDACHKDLHSYRNTPLDCFSCHKKDDRHEGQAGPKCETCHSDKAWKITRFDHATSAFALTGKHINVPCKSCHATSRYKDARSDCYSCHNNQDKHKQKLGMRCETCHNTRAWAVWSFDHNTRTKFVLEGAHRKARCDSCHTKPAPAGRDAAAVGTTCISCHKGEDVHDSQFGTRCEQCHTVTHWKQFKPRTGLPSNTTGGTP